MTAKEIIEIKVNVMSMAIEIYRLENHGAFNHLTGQNVRSTKSVTTIYKELVKQLGLQEHM